MEYKYERVGVYTAQAVINTYTSKGWRVHTFNRNKDAAVVDILFEREAVGGYVRD